MVMRFAAHGSVGVLDCDQAFYRVHGQNMHASTFAAALTVVEQHRRAFELLFQHHHDQVPGSERLREVAMCRTATNALSKGLKLFEQGDAAGCDSLARVALDIYPPLRLRREWTRFRIKRAIGSRLWRTVRPVIDQLRRPGPRDRSPFGRSGLFPGM
jgi:hypothetical protein